MHQVSTGLSVQLEASGSAVTTSLMNVAAKPLDAAVAERLVTAVTPVTIELGLETLTSALGRSRRRRPKLGHRGFADRELQARRDRSVQLLCRRCLPSRQSLASRRT